MCIPDPKRPWRPFIWTASLKPSGQGTKALSVQFFERSLVSSLTLSTSKTHDYFQSLHPITTSTGVPTLITRELRAHSRGYLFEPSIMAILSSCLCGSVETGSRLIALLSCINAAYMTVAPFDLKDKLDQFCLHANNSSIYCHYSQEDVYNKLLFMKVFWLSCSLLSSVLLVLGIHCRNRFLLLPWIFWNGFLTCIFLFLITPSRTQGSLLTLVFFTWTELCVISHYQNLRDENERPRNTTHQPNTHPIDAPESYIDGQSDMLHSGYSHSPPVTSQPPAYEECSAEGGLANSFAKRETPPPSYQECATFYQESETPAPIHHPETPKSENQPSVNETTPETRQIEGISPDSSSASNDDKTVRK